MFFLISKIAKNEMMLKEEGLYKVLVEKIYSRCHQIQVENERSVVRVNGIKKILRRRTRDCELLKRRLDKHGDNWRLVPMVVPQPKSKPEQKRRGPKPKSKQTTADTAAESQDAAPRKPRKQRLKKQPNPTASTMQTHLS